MRTNSISAMAAVGFLALTEPMRESRFVSVMILSV